MTDFNALLDPLADIAREAGKAILEVYEREDLGVETKDDKSPITEADKAAHTIIEARLQALTADIPVYSEESGDIAYAERRDWPRFWLVDPLDGTKEFIKRNGEFTVNIALIEGNRPVLGVVHVPVTGVTYLGGDGVGAFKEEGGARTAIHCRQRREPVIMVASRSHGGEAVERLEAFIREEIGDVERASMGSSLKLCLVAEGKADIYPRLAPTSEWDTAAAHAVVTAAGGEVVNTAFEPLQYNKEDILNPHFLVLGESVDQWRFIAPAIAG
ncbi:inositol 1-phosphatase [Alcanivorax hongdengensis A-11-3]|uniref:3'(2'),5'-bisphosphate nucleotidase CysQ n=1 Tax=Alcanivorax hongdengensis A-11-3 TaxID=1177179 RepID=L0WD82_9GAMM|nr:3'(2'),5'-bisphosphate nucleotidase CysQ [Alcanivorax hongdengensis]EKF74718.1 inositol 1-phosphatase [Alcanivorax hongdengensis A-11-3]